MTKYVGATMVLALLLILAAPLPAAAQGTCGSTVTVTYGDTLNKIAARCGTTVTAILQANPAIRNANLIYVGQRIRLPGAAPVPGDQGVQRIQFAPGSTSIALTGTAQVNSTNRYVLGASAGQTMLVDTATTQGAVILIIYGRDGTVLLTDHAGVAAWQGQLPSSQDYFIDVRSVGNVPARYTLRVTIPSQTGEQIHRIRFAPGATSATVQGRAGVNSMIQYVLGASAGQTMTVRGTTTQGQIILIVYGLDGTVLQTDHAGSSSFSGRIPATQDYFIDVRSVGNVPAAYTLQRQHPAPVRDAPPYLGAPLQDTRLGRGAPER